MGGPGGMPGRPGMGGPMGGRRGPMTVEKPKNMKKTAARLLSYIGKSKILLFVMIICVIFSALVTLASPILQTEALK